MHYTIIGTLKIDHFHCLYLCEISVKDVSSDAMFDSLISGNGTGEGVFKTAAVVLPSEEDTPPVPQKKQGEYISCMLVVCSFTSVIFVILWSLGLVCICFIYFEHLLPYFFPLYIYIYT
jgi:hypothetical protein